MSEWTETTLGTVMTAVDVRNRDRVMSLVLSVTEGRGIIPQTEVFKKRIATDDTSKYKIIEPLDIAWNPYLLWTGAIGQWLGDEPGVTSPVYPVYRCREDQDARFWGLVLECGRLTPYFDSRAIGSIQRRRRTTPEVFTAAPVEAPPLPMQERIVEVIGAVDDQIAALDAEAAALGSVINSILDAYSDVGDGKTRPLDELTTSIGSGPSWAATDESDRPREGALPVIKITNTRPDGSIDLNTMAYVSGLPATTRVIGPSSLVMIRTNGNRSRIGNTYMPSDEMHGLAVSAFQFIIEALDSDTKDHLFVALRSPRVQKLMSENASGSTGLGNLAVRWLKTLEVPWPDAITREERVKTVAAADTRLTATRAEAERLRAVRASLLSSLLTPPGEPGHINVEMIEQEAVGG